MNEIFTRLSVPLTRDEFIALRQLAEQENRDHRNQAQCIIHAALFGPSPDTAALVMRIDGLTKRIEALEEAQRLREGEL